MKKYAALCVFVLGFVFSTQINAQEKINVKEVAIKKVEALKQIMDLSKEQQQKLIELYKEFEIDKQKVANMHSRDGVQKLKTERSIQEKIESKLQGILNEKQYSLHLQHQKKMLYENSKM